LPNTRRNVLAFGAPVALATSTTPSAQGVLNAHCGVTEEFSV
jgi:hypothetical protein